MPGRTFIAGSGYRYGFNGQEKSEEIKGGGNSYTAMFWEYDPRLGRRWNLDPKPNISISQYACFNNNPLLLSDINGDTTTLMSTQGKLIGTINDGRNNEVHYLNRFQALKYKVHSAMNKSVDARSDYARSVSTAFIGENTIAEMKGIVKEGKNLYEVGFVGNISSTREIRLTSLGTKYSTRTASGWSYDMDKAMEDYNKSNPNAKPFLTGHLHPWPEEKSDKRSNLDKFYSLEPSKRYGKNPDYVPFLTNSNNIRIFESINGMVMEFLKGPHPLMIVTKYGFITYGSGKYVPTEVGSVYDSNSAEYEKKTSEYFHKF